MKPLIANIIMFVSVALLPWWAVAAVGVVLLFMIRSFYEIIVWGLVADLLYGIPVEAWYQISFVMTIGATALVVITDAIKINLRIYS